MEAVRPRILCTEDDRDTRELITVILTHEGFEVVCSESSQDALELARTKPFDLFLMDNWTPGLSGTQLCEAFRKFDVKTPILFYSGAAYDKDKDDARLAGAQGYLVKPADGDELIAEVVRIIAESKIAQPVGSVI
jgi:two-component system OmpR family response regulator